MKEGKKEEAESAKAQVAMLKADAKALEEIMVKNQFFCTLLQKYSFGKERLKYAGIEKTSGWV